MHWMYLIPLGTGLASGYYTLRSSDEITSFTGALTLICFLISLFIAPWQLQLLILVLVIAAARYYWQQLEARTEITPENAPKTQKEVSRNSNSTSFANTQANTQKEFPIFPSPPKVDSSSSAHRIYRGVAYEATDSPHDSLDGAKLEGHNPPQPKRYLGLPYETAGTPVPPLDQFENKPKQAINPKVVLRYRGVIIHPSESDSSEEE